MMKKQIEALSVLAFMGVLGFQSMSVGKSMPKQLKCENGGDMALREVYQKPTVRKNDVVEVSVGKIDLENEEFCDSLEILALCVEAEAGNQDLKGKRLVADVILNRVESSRFPDTIEGVISQKYQFTTYWDGSMDKITEPSDETFEAVKMELYRQRLDEDILFFTAGNYNTYCEPAYIVGDHYFGY
jgi:spore germination cell wall hydrolase CwlJ-like protein